MGLGLTKPGMPAAALVYPPKHSLAGQPVEPIGYLNNGQAVWPVMGGSEDEDDPSFTGEGGSSDDEDDSDDDEDDDDSKSKKRSAKKSKVTDDDDDEDDEDEKLTRPERQAARYRTRLRAKEKEVEALAARLKAIEDKDKPAEELTKREADEAKEKANRLEAKLRTQTLELAFFKANQIEWVDPSDVLKLIDLDEVDVDEDGTVDAKALRAALKDLAKRKPHLVKKSKAEPDDDEDEEDDDEEPRSRRSAPRMNSRRRGQGQKPSREELAKKFPVLGRP